MLSALCFFVHLHGFLYVSWIAPHNLKKDGKSVNENSIVGPKPNSPEQTPQQALAMGKLGRTPRIPSRDWGFRSLSHRFNNNPSRNQRLVRSNLWHKHTLGRDHISFHRRHYYSGWASIETPLDTAINALLFSVLHSQLHIRNLTGMLRHSQKELY